MNNVICIFDPSNVSFDETTPSKTGLGGSESWTVYISEAFARIPNTHIIIYNNCEKNHFHKDYSNIEYNKFQDFLNRSTYQKYDVLIFTRVVAQNIVDYISEIGCCDNIYLMTHDVYNLYLDKNDNKGMHDYQKLKNDKWLFEHLKGIFILSKHEKSRFINYFKFPEHLLYFSKHGIDQKLLNIQYDNERDNSIFWSNRIERNFDILVNDIAPLVIKEIPDFKIYCAFYHDLTDDNKKLLDKDYVINLGKLSKDNLYKEMQKHKCSFYPLLYEETFCISCIEQIMCGAQLVMPLRFGPADIFSPYKYQFLDKNIKFNSKEDIELVAQKIINTIKNYYNEDQILFRKSIREYIIENYNWDDIALDLYKKMLKNG